MKTTRAISVVALLAVAAAVVSCVASASPQPYATIVRPPPAIPPAPTEVIPSLPPDAPRAFLALVLKGLDGETLEIFGRSRVILIGIDAPEIDPPECFGVESQARMKQLVDGRRVYLWRDKLDSDVRTSYWFRYVWVDGQLLNERLVREGYARARVEEPNTRYAERLLEAERLAKEERLGLWSACLVP